MVTERGDVSTLERGTIYFFYRPKAVGKKPEEPRDIEQMYMLLTPDKKKEFRLAVIGHKCLPALSKKGKRRFWGFIDFVTEDPEALQKVFNGEDFGPAEPPDFLDYEGTQFVLISASANISQDLGITLNPDQEQKHSMAAFKELDLEKNTKRVKPLFEGKLV